MIQRYKGATKIITGGYSMAKVFSISQLNISKEGIKFINLLEIEGLRERERENISKYWKISMYLGEDMENLSQSFAVGITSNLTGETLIFEMGYFEDSHSNSIILRRLRTIGGKITTSNTKAIAHSVYEALITQPYNINEVTDISSLWLAKNKGNVPANKYYQKFLKHFHDNPNLFPKRSSDSYKHNISHGAILNNREKSNTGQYPVAIVSGELKKLLRITNDNKYRDVLEALVLMGVLESKLETRVVEREEKYQEKVAKDNMSVVIKTTIEKKRLDERITMNTKGQQANVFIFNINSI